MAHYAKGDRSRDGFLTDNEHSLKEGEREEERNRQREREREREAAFWTPAKSTQLDIRGFHID